MQTPQPAQPTEQPASPEAQPAQPEPSASARLLVEPASPTIGVGQQVTVNVVAEFLAPDSHHLRHDALIVRPHNHRP